MEIMSEILEGGCLCGRIRYQTTCLDSKIKINCHCRDCQKLSGGPYVSLMGIPPESFSVTGETSCFEHEGGSGGKMRAFCCSHCNGRVYGKPEIARGMILIIATSLDKPEIFTPNADVFVKSAVPWDRMDETIPKYEGAFSRG
ncbi:MAG: GFA family protein [Halopseudomonas aestusnigri]